MMKIKIHLQFLVAFFTLLLLFSCGGSDSSDDGDETPPIKPGEIRGKVLGSYIKGALVCIDENENGRCDSTDQYQVRSAVLGDYSFTGIPDAALGKPLVVEVPRDAVIVDPATGLESPALLEYRMSYPPSTVQSRYVSVLSTLVHQKTLAGASLEDAKAEVSKEMSARGISLSSEELVGNYVSSAVAANVSKVAVKNYNAAKLIGEALKTTQQSNLDPQVEWGQFLSVAAESIFSALGNIERNARDNNLLTQAETANLMGQIASVNNLTVSAEEIERKKQLAALAYPLRDAFISFVRNYTDRDSNGSWNFESELGFDLPKQTTEITLDQALSLIPSQYSLGFFKGLNGQGALVSESPFAKSSAGDLVYNEFYWDQGSSRLYIYLKHSSEFLPEGDYSVYLCGKGCSNSEDKVWVGNHTINPNTFDVGSPENLENLEKILNSELQMYMPEGNVFSNDTQQMVFFSLPQPEFGSAYLVELKAIDKGKFYSLEDVFLYGQRPILRRGAPKALLNDANLEISLTHWDSMNKLKSSWVARTPFISPVIEKRRSFIPDDVFDVYRGDYNDSGIFREGVNIDFEVYLGSGKTLEYFYFEKSNGDVLDKVCLPKIPSEQSALASFSDLNRSDSNDGYWGSDTNQLGCKLLGDSIFGLSGDYITRFALSSRTRNDLSAHEVFRVGMVLVQTDSDFNWGEPGNVLTDLAYLVLKFEGGETQRYPLGFDRPNHDFGLVGAPAINVCSIDSDNIKVSYTPPGWMLEEYDQGELTIKLDIEPRTTSNKKLNRLAYNSTRGAKSIVVSKALLTAQANPGEIANFEFYTHIGDQDYYDWTQHRRTYWTRFDFYDDDNELSYNEVINAAACN